MSDLFTTVDVGQFGPDDSNIDRYKQAGEYALESKLYAYKTKELYDQLKDDVFITDSVLAAETAALQASNSSEEAMAAAEEAKSAAETAASDATSEINQQLQEQKEEFDADQIERRSEYDSTLANLVPLSRQYMTLSQAQSDIANIPLNSTTFVKSSSDLYLAEEYINTGGTLVATGKRLPNAVMSGYQASTATSSSSENSVTVNIPGRLVDGSLIYFFSPTTNTGPSSVTVIDYRGVSITRNILKRANAALSGRELIQSQPVLMEFRGAPIDNFMLVASGPTASEVNLSLSNYITSNDLIVSSNKSSTDASISLLNNSVTESLGPSTNILDAYSASSLIKNSPLKDGKLFTFTPNVANTTRVPTLSIDGLTARQIKQNNGAQVAPGDLSPGYTYLIKFNLGASDFRLQTYPSDRSIMLSNNIRGVVTSTSSSPNEISITIPGSLGDGTPIYFEPVASNTGATTLIVTDRYGIVYNRAIQKGANSPLSGGEFSNASPAFVVYRGAPQNNFKLVTSGDLFSSVYNLTSEVSSLKNATLDPLSNLSLKLIGDGSATNQSPFGNIVWSNGEKTVTKKQIICTSIGSSVGVGAGSTGGSVAGAAYAPNTLFVNALKEELKQYGEFDIIDDNQCIPTQAFQQFSAQLDNSPYPTSDFVLIVGGMNDAPVGNFNTGRTFPAQKTTLEGLIDKCIARGSIPIICTTPHHNVENPSTAPSIPNGTTLFWPFRTFGVSTSYAFNSENRTITQTAFSNSTYGGNIFKAGHSLQVVSGDNAGVYTISSISPDRNTITVAESIPTTQSYTVMIRQTNLNNIKEDLLYPAPSKSFVQKDWTGSGVSVLGDVRFEMVNNMMRSVARQKGVILADVVFNWFSLGVEKTGWSSLFNSPNYNHPNDLGYSISYGVTLKEVARKVSSLIAGDRYIK